MTRQHRTRRRLAAPASPGSTESPGGEGRFEEGPDARQCRRGFAGGSTLTEMPGLRCTGDYTAGSVSSPGMVDLRNVWGSDRRIFVPVRRSYLTLVAVCTFWGTIPLVVR